MLCEAEHLPLSFLSAETGDGSLMLRYLPLRLTYRFYKALLSFLKETTPLPTFCCYF